MYMPKRHENVGLTADCKPKLDRQALLKAKCCPRVAALSCNTKYKKNLIKLTAAVHESPRVDKRFCIISQW